MTNLLKNINNRIEQLSVRIKDNLLAATDRGRQSCLRGSLSGVAEVADIVKQEFASYNNGWHKVEDGMPLKEGVYDITYIGIDPLTNQYDTYLTTCFYSETYAAFMGYSSRVIAWRERPPVYIPENGLPLRPIEEDD